METFFSILNLQQNIVLPKEDRSSVSTITVRSSVKPEENNPLQSTIQPQAKQVKQTVTIKSTMKPEKKSTPIPIIIESSPTPTMPTGIFSVRPAYTKGDRVVNVAAKPFYK